MKTLKKTLCLVLAVVMVVGVMVLPASADYNDADEIEYKEAVDVLTGLGVIDGMPSGGFEPERTLTREEAAKIVTYMLLGKTNADKLGTNQAIFVDVAAGRWSAGYIAYCVQMGILSGVGNGKFDPEGKLTGSAFGKMLLVALGYDAEQEGYLGASWEINVATDMIDAGIDVDGTIFSAPLTREEAAEMAFQTLMADMVQYDGRRVEVNGVVIEGNPATAVTNEDNDPDYDSSSDDVLQFCEKYFPGLEISSIEDDEFGRPIYTWSNNGEEIGEYEGAGPVKTYTSSVSADDIAKDLKGFSFRHYAADGSAAHVSIKAEGSWTSESIKRVNGAGAENMSETTKTPAQALSELTGNGTLVEIYASKKVINRVVVINYTVAEVTSATVSRDGSEYTKTAYTIGASTTGTVYEDPDKVDQIVFHGDVAKGDIVTYVDLAGSDPIHVYPTTVITGIQTANNRGNATITVDGSVYTVGTGVTVDNASGAKVAITSFANGTTAANFWLDQYGFAVKSNTIEINDYAVIDAIRWTSDSTALDDGGAATARLLLTDGTTVTAKIAKINDVAPTQGAAGITSSAVTVSATQSANNSVYHGLIVTYTVSGEKYTLKTANTAIDSRNVKTVTGSGDGVKVVTKGVPKLVGMTTSVIGNNETVYIIKTSATAFSVATGYQNVSTVTIPNGKTAKVSFVQNSATDTTAKIIFIDASDSGVGDKAPGTMVYVYNAEAFTESGSGSTLSYIFDNVVIDGTTSSLTFTPAAKASITSWGLYEVTLDSDGKAVAAVQQNVGTTFVKSTVQSVAKGILDTNAATDYYTYNGTETVYLVSGGTISPSTAEAAMNGDTVYVKVAGQTGAASIAVSTMYIVKNTDDQVPTFNVTFAADDSGAATTDMPATIVVQKGSKVSLPAAKATTAASFLCWTDGTNLYASGDSVTINAGLDLKAIYLNKTASGNVSAAALSGQTLTVTFAGNSADILNGHVSATIVVGHGTSTETPVDASSVAVASKVGTLSFSTGTISTWDTDSILTITVKIACTNTKTATGAATIPYSA